MTKIVLDASAILALLNQEPGFDTVEKHIPNAVVSAVNFAEVVTGLINIGISIKDAKDSANGIMQHIIPFDHKQALLAGTLRETTKSLGLSLGDRACLALAMLQNLPVLTADKVWTKLSGDLKIKIILAQ